MHSYLLKPLQKHFKDKNFKFNWCTSKEYLEGHEVHSFQPNVALHKETSHLIYSANQMTGFYMKHNPGLKWVKKTLD